MYAFRHSTGKTQSAVVQTCWGGKTHITRCQSGPDMLGRQNTYNTMSKWMKTPFKWAGNTWYTKQNILCWKRPSIKKTLLKQSNLFFAQQNRCWA